MHSLSIAELHASTLALAAAERVLGRTEPNPPVGACLLSKEGVVLASAGHEGAGQPHAEARAIEWALQRHGADAVRNATLFVTLEPCNHQGRTPPCTQAILKAGIRRVVFNCRDVNPNVAGGGADFLRSKDVYVLECPTEAATQLLRPYSHWVTTGKPWVLHKIVLRFDQKGQGTMLPESGQKTFAHQESLVLAHELRRQSKAILTTLPTILADNPEFTVRHTWDHEHAFPKKLVILSRQPSAEKLLPSAWRAMAEKNGFECHFFDDLNSALTELGRDGVHQLLVEAGPRFSASLSAKNLWNERILITVGENSDFVLRECRNVHGNC